MKQVFEKPDELKSEKSVTMKPLIDQLIKAILYSSLTKGILIINDVNPAMQSKSDRNILALILGNLIKDTICYSENDCIRISSSDSGEIIISSKKNNLSRNRSFMVCVDSLQVIAERLGNPVSISGSFTNGTEIFVRFNKKAA